MKCPRCSGIKQRVIESRPTEDSVWRRRVCSHCFHVFITRELVCDDNRLPTEAHRWKNDHRKAPAKTPKPKDGPGVWDTSSIQNLKWNA